MTDYEDVGADAGGTADVPGVVALPAWLAAIRQGADRAYDANPGAPLRPEIAARIRRIFPPARTCATPGLGHEGRGFLPGG